MAGISHRENHVVAFSNERMFDLVADVERYPEFLPLMRKATIVRRHASGYETEQTLALGPLSHRFRTRTELDMPRSIVVTSADRAFRRFDIRWSFTPTSEGCCRIDFTLDCEVRSIWLKPLGARSGNSSTPKGSVIKKPPPQRSRTGPTSQGAVSSGANIRAGSTPSAWFLSTRPGPRPTWRRFGDGGRAGFASKAKPRLAAGKP